MSDLKCRACLATYAAEYVDMDTYLSCGKVTYLQFFNQCTQLQISLEENLPRILCNICTNDLASAYMFVQTAIQSNTTLNMELTASKDEVEATEKVEEFLDDCEVLHCDDEFIMEETVLEESINVDPVVIIKMLDQKKEKKPTLLPTPLKKKTHAIKINVAPEFLSDNEIKKENVELQKHKILPNDKKYLCSYCPRQLKTPKSLWQHERTHMGVVSDVVYMCEDCDRQYCSQFLLEQHRKQAHKEKENVCSICGNAFKLKNQLANHMRLHLEKNLQCPHCEKRYARNFDLKVHIRSHTGELPFSCHLCDRRFAIKVRLTYHLQKHYGVKHRCRECGMEFNSKQKLKGHSFKHTGMPYRCTFCNNWGFANRDVFKRHLLRVHNTTMSDEELVAMFRQNTGKTTKIFEVQNAEELIENGIIDASHFINKQKRLVADIVESDDHMST